MNCTLTRKSFTPDGIFGELRGADNQLIAVTLEHSYDNVPKLPDGLYECQRGQHQLASMLAPFETFEIMNVPGHTNILLHVGNYNRDSEGCVLLGAGMGDKMILESHIAFNRFMALQADVDQFELTVKTG